jgi:RNase P protein component
MTKAGTGLAAIQERIRKSFLEVHHDQRTREQREADEEMIASIAPRKSGTEVVRERIQEAFREVHADLSSREGEEQRREAVVLIEKNATSIPNGTTEQRVSACISAALRSPHIPKHPPLRSDVHRCHTVEEPRESADTFFAQALRYLEGK